MKGAKTIWDVASTAVMVIVSLTVLGLYLHDRSAAAASSSPPHISEWRDWEEAAFVLGPATAPVVVSAFMDFTCPFCQTTIPVLDSLQAEYGDDIALWFHHFPLDGREHSIPAAIASECAGEQGKFSEMYHTLYTQIDSFGQKPWNVIASEAGVPDLASFNECTSKPADQFERIHAGKALGLEIGIAGTPALWMNGTLTDRSLSILRARAEELGASPVQEGAALNDGP